MLAVTGGWNSPQSQRPASADETAERYKKSSTNINRPFEEIWYPVNKQ